MFRFSSRARWLPETIVRFTAAHPGIDVAVHEGSHAELAKPLAGHMDVDAIWSFSSATISGVIEAEAAGNVKRTWVNHGRARDWAGAEGHGREFLRQATEVKTVWVPYGE